MGAIESASRSLRTLLRTPTLFLAAAGFGLLKLPVEAVRVSWLYWLLALATILFTPAALAGLYGLAAGSLDDDEGGSGSRRSVRTSADDDATGRPKRDGRTQADEASGGRPKRDGRTVTDDGAGDWPGRGDGGTAVVPVDSAGADPSSRRLFRDGVVGGYFDLLAANVLYAFVQHAVLVVFVAVAAVVGGVPFGAAVAVQALADGPRVLVGVLGLLALVLVALVAAVYVVVRAVLFFFLQLYRPAAVVGDAGPVGAFGESYRLVRANPRSAVGFVLVRAFAFLVFLLPGAVALAAFLAVELTVFEQFVGDQLALLGLGAAVLAYGIGVVQLAFLGTYRVAFYRELADAANADDGHRRGTADAGDGTGTAD